MAGQWRDPDADRQTVWHGDDRIGPGPYPRGGFEGLDNVRYGPDRAPERMPRRADRRDRREEEPGRGYRDDDEAWREADPLARRDQAYRRAYRRPEEDRSFWDRSRDEVAAWFGDRGAEERRHADGQHRGRGPRGYRRADHRIHEDVNDRLTEDPWLDATDIRVRVEDGEVTLGGHVYSVEDRDRAHDIAAHVMGVRQVRNALRVNAPPRDWPEGAWERPY